VHVALLNVNEPLFEAPLGDDATVLRQLGERVERVTVVIASRRSRQAVQLTPNVRLVPAPAADRARGLLGMVRALRGVHAEAPIDLIQAQECMYTGLAGAVASRAIGARLTVGVFGSDPGDPSFRAASAGHRAAAVLGWAILRRADAVQSDSQHTVATMASRGITARYKPMTPANLTTFLEAFPERVYRKDARKLLFVGRLGRQKRLDLLLRAAAQLDVELVVVGDGPDREPLEQLARGLGLAAEFRGQVAHSALRDAYAQADLLAMSSHYEGMPRAFIEAGATGLPIVSTRVAGALDLERVAPIWIAPPSPEGYADTLRAALGDATRRRRCGELLHAAMAERLEELPPPDQQVAIWRALCGEEASLL
jgi:teichuronic acid biosynthesis glycosyltransferase TuaC